MLKSQEHRLKLAMEKFERQHEDRLNLHAWNFEYEVQKLQDVAKEHRELFVEEVKNVEESVNLKVIELKTEITKEVAMLDQN